MQTRRRLERPTWGPYWGRAAAALGRPYMPWQQAAANLAGEVDLDTGRLAYRKVVLTVPRQSGKSTLLLSIAAGRAEAGDHFGGRQTMLYAAQKREDAKEKFLDDYVNAVRQAECMNGRFSFKVGNGSEELRWFSSGTTMRPIATLESSGHGKVLDLGLLDEAFDQVDDRVEQAWRPAMITRPMAQLWMVSTMGDATAIWWNAQIAKARETVRADTGYGTCYIEYSAPPEEDRYDHPDVWKACMPALGHTQSIGSIQLEFDELGLNDFRRAYLNQQVDAAADQVLSADHLKAMKRDPADAVRATTPVIIYDVAFDRRASTVALAYELADGTPAMRIVEHGPGTNWVVDAVLRLRDELGVWLIVADARGPASSITKELVEVERIAVHTTSASDMATACGMIYDGVENETFAWYGEQVLNKAVQGAAKRPLGDAWAWGRKSSLEDAGTDISPLVAVTLGLWAQVTMGEHAGDDMMESFG